MENVLQENDRLLTQSLSVDIDQAKDTVILKLKEKLKSLSGDMNERNVKREVEEIETLNIELDHKSAKVSDLNACLQEKVLVITALKEQLNKLKGKAVLTDAVSLNPIDPKLLKVDVAPLPPKLRQNRTAHTDYITHTQGEAVTLREIVESEKLLNLLNTSLDYALPPREPIPIVNSTDKPVVTLVYSRKPKVANKKVPVSNSTISKSLVANKLEPNNSWGSSSSNVSSSLINCRLSKSSSAYTMGKSTKKTHKPKSKDTNKEKLYLLHMDLCGPMRFESINGKKYILVIVDDYSRFTWVKFLRSKDETLDFIIKFLKMIQVRLNALIRHIRIDNGTEFVNQTLRDYYEESHALHNRMWSLKDVTVH
nr:ribonuclease H-like domain-containing protein [Tanacetum cinerariifolium]